MLDVANFGLFFPVRLFDQLLQFLLAIDEVLRSQVFSTEKKKIESEKDQVVGFSLREGSLQTCEIGRTSMIECDDFPINDAVGQ